MTTPTFTRNSYGIGQHTQHVVPGALSGGSPFGTVIVYAKASVANPSTAPVLPVWNGSVYQLDASWSDAVVAYITDDAIVRAGETVITWPDAQSRLNFANCRYLNESKDFKEDTVSWPNKLPIDASDTVYATYLAEDSQLPLETDQFLTGITSEYLAKAKAEHLVRTSRGTLTYSFSVNRDFIYLEPGDIIKFQSDVLGIPGALPAAFSKQERALYGDLLMIKEIKPDTSGVLKISAVRYDANMLAWNVVDTEPSVERRLFKLDLGQATYMVLDTETKYLAKSPGRLLWTDSTDTRVTSYAIKVAYSSIPSLSTPWLDLGVATSGRVGFDLPPLSSGSYLLTVVAQSTTRIAPQRGWPILDMTINSTFRSVTIAASSYAFVSTGAGTWSVPSITLVANATDFEKPTYFWYVDDVPLLVEGAQAVSSSIVIEPFAVNTKHVYKVEVREAGSIDNYLEATNSVFLYSVPQNGTLVQLAFTEPQKYILCDADGTVNPFDQLPYSQRAWVIRGATLLNDIQDSNINIVFTTSHGTISDNGDIVITEMPLASLEVLISATVTYFGVVTVVSAYLVLNKKISTESVIPRVTKIGSDGLAFITPSNSSTTSTSSITVYDLSTGYTQPVRRWYVDDVLQAGQTAATFVLPSFAPSVGAKTVKLEIAEEYGISTGIDYLKIFSVKEGDDAISITASDANKVVAADHNGELPSGYLPFTTQIFVARGVELIQTNAGVTYIILSQTGISGCSVSSTGLVTVGINSAPLYGMTADQATVVVRVTVNKSLTGAASNTVYDQSIVVTKASEGTPGASAPLLTLTTSGYAFVYADAQATTSPSPDIVFNAVVQNVSLTGLAYTFTAYNASNTSLGTISVPGAGASRTLTNALFNTYSNTTHVKVLATLGALSDTTTIYRGNNGTDSITAILSNESHTLAAASNGTVLSYTGASTTIKVFKGIVDDTANWTFTAAISTGTATATFNEVAVPNAGFSGVTAPLLVCTGLSTDQATITITATKAGAPTQTKIFSLSKSIKGVSGNSVYTGFVYLQSAGAPSAPTGGSYNFTTGMLTAPAGWTVSQPSSTTIPTYCVEFNFNGAAGATVTAGTWTNLHIDAVRGADGTNVMVVELFKEGGGALPGIVTYDFINNTVSGTLSGWTLSMPAVTSTPMYMTTCRFTATAGASTANSSSWTAAVIVAQNGVSGNRGSIQNYYTSASYTSGFIYGGNSAGDMSYRALAAASMPTPNINGDMAVFSNGSSYTFSVVFNGSSWAPPGTVIDGGLLVTGSITTSHLSSSISLSTNGYISATGGTTVAGRSATAHFNSSQNYTYGTVAYGASSGTSIGVMGLSLAGGGMGVYGYSPDGIAVRGDTTNSSAIVGNTVNGIGLYGFAPTTGYARALVANGNSQLAGTVEVNGVITSTVTSVAPFVISSSALCANLNANYLNGNTAAAFATAGHTHSGTYAAASHISSADHDGRYPHNWPTDSGIAYASSGMNLLTSGIGGVQTRGTGNVIYIEAISDERLKQDIIPEALGLDFVNSLKPVTYRLIAKPEMKHHGFIAQDLGKLIETDDDSLYQTNDSGMHGVDYQAIIGPLVKAVQELTARIQALENK